MMEEQMGIIADALDEVLSAPDDEDVRRAVRARMAELGAAFPLYESI
jgi:glycine/serine hydroxymethyltransferase